MRSHDSRHPCREFDNVTPPMLARRDSAVCAAGQCDETRCLAPHRSGGIAQEGSDTLDVGEKGAVLDKGQARRVFQGGLIAFGVLTSPIVSASVGTASLCLSGVQPCATAGQIWWVWWLGDAMGALIVAPVLFVWASVGRAWPHGRPTLRLVAFLGLVAAVSWLVFAGPVGRQFPHYPFHYALVPVMIGAVVGYGPLGMTTVMAWGFARWTFTPSS